MIYFIVGFVFGVGTVFGWCLRVALVRARGETQGVGGSKADLLRALRKDWGESLDDEYRSFWVSRAP